MLNRINFGIKIVIVVAISFIISFIINFLFVKDQIEEDYLQALFMEAKSVALLSGDIRTSIGEMWQLNVLQKDRLFAETKEKMAGIQSNEERLRAAQKLPIYQIIPIVRSWQAIENNAQELGFKFKVISESARNPRNLAQGQEIAILRTMTEQNKQNHYQVDTRENVLRYVQRINIESSCLVCHGNTTHYSGNNGKDVLGFQMEDFKVGDTRGGFQFTFSLLPMQKKIRTFIIQSTAIGMIIILFIIFFILWSVKKLAINPVRHLRTLMDRIAQGDLNVHAQTKSQDDIGLALNALNLMAKNLHEIISNVIQAAQHVYAGSDQLSSSSQMISQGATEQAASAEEAAASIEEMTQNIAENTDNAIQTEKIASEAAQEAQMGGNAVDEAVAAMKKIAEKIQIIDEISTRTNLLALNASIEAARAGAQGRGFAVVASEVRDLAEKSQIAAGEIIELAQSSVQVADRAGKILLKLVPNIQSTSDLVKKIAHSSQEQSTGANQINTAMRQLDDVVQQNASAAEELASTAEELSGQSKMLLDSTTFFKIESQT